MDITDVKYYSISSTTDGYLELQVKMYFDYTVSYDSVGETKTKDKKTFKSRNKETTTHNQQ